MLKMLFVDVMAMILMGIAYGLVTPTRHTFLSEVLLFSSSDTFLMLSCIYRWSLHMVDVVTHHQGIAIAVIAAVVEVAVVGFLGVLITAVCILVRSCFYAISLYHASFDLLLAK